MIRKTLVLVFSIGMSFGVSAMQESAPAATTQPATAEAIEQPPSVAPTQAEAEKPSDDDKLVCRKEKVTGSNRVKRICRTKDEAQQMATQEAMRRLQRTGPKQTN